MTEYSTDKEEWKDVFKYKGIYQVSNQGNVRSVNRKTSCGRNIKGRVLKKASNGSGYLFVKLSKDGVAKAHYVHRLVAEMFLTKSAKKKEVDHLDSNKTNNCVGNLEWVTRKENMNRSWSDGLMERQRVSAVETGKKRAKPVAKLDMGGNLLEIYESQSVASEMNGVPAPNISMSCTGARGSAGGYIWKHASEIG